MNNGASMTSGPIRTIAPGGSDPECEAALRALHGYLFLTDPEGRVRFLSRAPLGYGLAWFLGKPIDQLVAASQRPLVRDALQQLRDGAASIELDVQGIESARWYRLRAAAVRDGGVVSGLAVHALDIDDHKRSEAEVMRLRSRPQRATNVAEDGVSAGSDAQHRFEIMADALPVLISYVDKERRYQFNNIAYERFFGRSREDLRGRDVRSVLGIEAYEQIRGYVDAALGGRAVSFELTVPYKDAGVRRVVAHYVPDIRAAGNVEGFFGLVEDVTERWEAESALRQRDDEVRQLQKIEALGRLAGGVAHDFANLLQIVATSSDSALLTMPTERSERRELLRIKRAAENGVSLTRQLLSFSRKQDLRLAPLDVDAVLDDMKLVLERLLGRSIAVEFDLAARSMITADYGQLQQIVLNLAINARDAMPRGGRLRVSSGCIDVDPAPRRADALPPGRYVTVVVTDTGTGMDPKTASKIFEPFFTTKAPGKGTGLGLSTVYGVVQSLGGRVDVQSELGKGTTFRLCFPCLGPAPAD